jgi:uncharacterized protein with beta-barrel porin domain
VTASFVSLPAGGFTIFGASPSANAALVSIGAQIDLHSGLTLAATGEGDFSEKVSGYRGQLSLRYVW